MTKEGLNPVLELALRLKRFQRPGQDPNKGAVIPDDDIKDLMEGATQIPDEVTEARRKGEKVQFVSACSPSCWHWVMPDDTRHYHSSNPCSKCRPPK